MKHTEKNGSSTEYTELYRRLAEKQTERQEIYDGVILHVVRDSITLPNGNPSKREVVLHNGAVAIVALTEDNELIMERQYRYPFDQVIWEIPAGKIDRGETDPHAAAERELREETGITAGKLTYIGDYYPSPAILSERIRMYLATDLKYGEQDLDEDEFMEICRLPLQRVVNMIMNGEIPDGKTQAAVLKVNEMLRKQGLMS
ncbi:MAG: NUDIX hydrolase [Clostridia bacterium]|nr:NUDIX hydrolase [Clostridia bacterium]